MGKEGTLGNVWEGNACNSIIHDSKSSRKQHFKNALLTVLLLSWMTWVFAQATKTGKEIVKKQPATHVVTNDSIDIHGFRVSADEAKVYKEFLADREQYASDEEMMAQYTKTIGKVRRRRDIKEKLVAAEKNEKEIDQVIVAQAGEEKEIDQVIVAGGDRIESKKQVIVAQAEEEKEIDQVIVAQAGEEKEIDQVIVAQAGEEKEIDQDNKELKEDKKELIEENKQLKQQLFKAREKKLGRALTEKEKEEILKNIHSRQ